MDRLDGMRAISGFSRRSAARPMLARNLTQVATGGARAQRHRYQRIHAFACTPAAPSQASSLCNRVVPERIWPMMMIGVLIGRSSIPG
jgi:hypothetical protein